VVGGKIGPPSRGLDGDWVFVFLGGEERIRIRESKVQSVWAGERGNR
jgi:hypothetical protein